MERWSRRDGEIALAMVLAHAASSELVCMLRPFLCMQPARNLAAPA